MRQAFVTEVQAIEDEIRAGLGQAVQVLGVLDEAILDPTRTRADAVSGAGQALRRQARALELRLVSLSATQAPVACDLRLVLTLVQLVQHQGLIANQFVMVGEQLACIDPAVSDRGGTGRQVAELARLSSEQLRLALDAFSKRDCEQVEQLDVSDDRLDRLNREICRLALEMRAGSDHRELAFRHVLIARSLERIGDNAVNVARHTAVLVRADVHKLAHPHQASSLTVF